MTNALPPAHWAADPSGRHEYRYWDGTGWTDHVADHGVQGLDPVAGDPVPTVDSSGAGTTDGGPLEPLTWRPEPDEPAESLTWPPEPADATEPTATSPDPAAPVPVTPDPAAPVPVAATATTPAVVSPPPPPPPTAGTGLVGVGGAPAWGSGTWRSLDGLKTALVLLFSAMALGSVWLLGAYANRIQKIDDFQRNPLANAQHLRDADDALSTAVGFYTIVRVALIVVFIIWLWRAAKNALEPLRREQPRFTPGWSIGSWFIPLANFVIPVMIIQGLWRASAPGTSPGTWWKDTKGSAMVGVWWAAFLMSSIAAFAVNDDAKLDDVKNADALGAVGALASLVAAVLAIVIVVRLTRRFDERRAEELGA